MHCNVCPAFLEWHAGCLRVLNGECFLAVTGMVGRDKPRVVGSMTAGLSDDDDVGLNLIVYIQNHP